jgi:hypothetical protein
MKSYWNDSPVYNVPFGSVCEYVFSPDSFPDHLNNGMVLFEAIDTLIYSINQNIEIHNILID